MLNQYTSLDKENNIQSSKIGFFISICEVTEANDDKFIFAIKMSVRVLVLGYLICAGKI